MSIEKVRAPNPGPFTLDGTNSWVLSTSAIIDPGPDIASHVDALLAAAPELDTVLVTHRHPDHAPAALPLKWRRRARILAPVGCLDDEFVDTRISDGDVIEAGLTRLTVVATPGHTAEHVCFLNDDGVLFSGDMILGAGTTTIFPPDGHMGSYIASLRYLREFKPRRVHPGHGPDREDAVALIDEYIAHRLAREREIVAALFGGSRTIPELKEVVYPRLHPSLSGAAETQLLAHLIYLQEQGEVTRFADPEGHEFWQPVLR